MVPSPRRHALHDSCVCRQRQRVDGGVCRAANRFAAPFDASTPNTLTSQYKGIHHTSYQIRYFER
ncbi:hypothetical protein HanRHA438_Chr01g0004141 [Helianthus annuus]|nr:hypothetical protein HanRHA438_Chr01g0004141 [Helianthus annuus]